MFTSRFEQSSQSLISQPHGYGPTETIRHSEASNGLIHPPSRPSICTQGPLSPCKLFTCITAALVSHSKRMSVQQKSICFFEVL